jgi:hypothetical protein
MTSIAILEAVNTSYVPFNGQQIITAMVAGVAYVAMKPIVENLGLDWPSQHRKLMNSNGKFNHCHMTMVALDKKLRDVLCIPLKKLNGWLFSINPEKVRADIRDKLIQYQEECFTVLHDYWTKGKAENPRKKTTVDERTPLRDAVNMLVSKKHLMYPEAYAMIHQRFNVESIEDLEVEQIPSAIEYLHRVALEGDLMPLQNSLPLIDNKQFNDSELYELVCLCSIALLISEDVQKVIPVMIALGSPWATTMSGNQTAINGFITRAARLLMRESKHISEMKTPPLNWQLEISRMQKLIN